MYKRPILVLVILGALMILVGTGFTANEKPVVAKKANVTNVNQSDDCYDGIPINCETGEPCTPEEIEECMAKRQSGNASATGVSAKVNALTISTKSTTAGQCDSKKDCQPKNCGSKGSI